MNRTGSADICEDNLAGYKQRNLITLPFLLAVPDHETSVLVDAFRVFSRVCVFFMFFSSFLLFVYVFSCLVM